jgi:AraC-like DNA-binding protein
MSEVLDIINSIAVFQLVFFSLYLFFKGSKVPSTFFLKIHLISQLLSFFSYFYFSSRNEFLRPFLAISFPAMFLWGPTFYIYIRSRLYKGFKPGRKLLFHGIPSLIVFVVVTWMLIRNTDARINAGNVGRILYYFLKVQLSLYIFYSLYIIHRYQKNIRFLTSADENRKLNWLLLFTYGILFTSTGDMILNSIPEFKFAGLGYILFWLFINVFFFKAIIQPDQFLGIDENKLRPLNMSTEKSVTYYHSIEEVINSNQLYLDPDLNLHNIAQAVNLADRAVSQAIKQSTKMSFIDYINIKRIDYAKNLLVTTSPAEKNILEILYESGFNSKSVFNTQFKKHTGKAPKEFRKSFST